MSNCKTYRPNEKANSFFAERRVSRENFVFGIPYSMYLVSPFWVRPCFRLVVFMVLMLHVVGRCCLLRSGISIRYILAYKRTFLLLSYIYPFIQLQNHVDATTIQY